MTMTSWLSQLRGMQQQGQVSVVVTVARVRGSAPREPGAKMLVGAATTWGTIGGGQLEWQSIQIARQQLTAVETSRQQNPSVQQLRNFALGTNCGQCCGGAVEILFEVVMPTTQWVAQLAQVEARRERCVLATRLDAGQDQKKEIVRQQQVGGSTLGKYCAQLLATSGISKHVQLKSDDGGKATYLLEPFGGCRGRIAVFGAGHVGAAVVDTLAKLDYQISWIDARAGIFPQLDYRNVACIVCAHPVEQVARLATNSMVLIMTHSHALDFDLCANVLQRDDIAYCGLIGSASKRRRFERLCKQLELPAAALSRLTCPIGVGAVTGKAPYEIAISVASQLLALNTQVTPALQASNAQEGPGASLHS